MPFKAFYLLLGELYRKMVFVGLNQPRACIYIYKGDNHAEPKTEWIAYY